MNTKHSKKSSNSRKNNPQSINLEDSHEELTQNQNRDDVSLSEEKSALDMEKENLQELEESKEKSTNDDQEQNQSMIYEETISKLREEKLRLLAEMENIRKRFEREKSDSVRYGSKDLARDILSPRDNLIRALENIPDKKNLTEQMNNLVEGLEMVQKEFMTILEKHGVKKIDALNKKFDHNVHQAMLEIEDSKKEEGMVVQEIQSGYTIYDKLLRPSLVGVSKKPKRTKKN